MGIEHRMAQRHAMDWEWMREHAGKWKWIRDNKCEKETLNDCEWAMVLGEVKLVKLVHACCWHARACVHKEICESVEQKKNVIRVRSTEGKGPIRF
jgi:hypothetical protein